MRPFGHPFHSEEMFEANYSCVLTAGFRNNQTIAYVMGWSVKFNRSSYLVVRNDPYDMKSFAAIVVMVREKIQ